MCLVLWYILRVLMVMIENGAFMVYKRFMKDYRVKFILDDIEDLCQVYWLRENIILMLYL